MTHKTEFPDFTLDVTIPDGFEDHSWHNDVCPHFVKQISENRCLSLWIDYADRAASEFPDFPRFLIEVLDTDKLGFEDAAITSLHSNVWQEIVNFAAQAD